MVLFAPKYTLLCFPIKINYFAVCLEMARGWPGVGQMSRSAAPSWALSSGFAPGCTHCHWTEGSSEGRLSQPGGCRPQQVHPSRSGLSWSSAVPFYTFSFSKTTAPDSYAFSTTCLLYCSLHFGELFW